ncbi:MAG TPA: fructosamine kinase family protein [Methylophaga aminisulfidivorans]|uniref:Fructosamine kinase family protein n=1 Tax=Methylophaga aminisulfidivorans TaxID=230105 RepID=A0A7C1ZGD1_9GAMM|nr:fructosamine kinase family protein [Methylophaga aminisulfidivorans]HEC73388.1 fructosamine kinase family protein [Methylophaga aminisulfidivorans]
MADVENIIDDIEQATQLSLRPYQLSSLGGGCINTAYKLSSDDHCFFIKTNAPSRLDMFEAEAQGLQEMSAVDAVRIPHVICFGSNNRQSYLVLEYIHIGSLRGSAAAQLGEQLAQLHAVEKPYFGWSIDNTIGSTPQLNKRHHDWPSFWQQNRLAAQLRFASENGFGGSLQKQGEKLINKLDVFFAGYSPKPSLLHGDLWGGNAGADENGQPVIFDPACYYGDRETDLAMTELFGGFGGDFFAAYKNTYPLDAGYNSRKTLYNLYHILNHLNLFGGGYLGQAESMINQLLAEC